MQQFLIGEIVEVCVAQSAFLFRLSGSIIWLYLEIIMKKSEIALLYHSNC